MPQTDVGTLEVCVDTVAGLTAAQAHADEIELCSALTVGGLTPSPGLIAAARTSRVPVNVMIRPRAGGFLFSDAEVDQCVADIHAAKAAGLAGVVIGAARDGALDVAALKPMIDAANGMAITLHRVIDVLSDPIAALETAIDLGIGRVLTSGGAPQAVHGLAVLRTLHKVANGRITVMAGSGVNVETIGSIATATGIRAFHASCRRDMAQAAIDQTFGFAPPVLHATDPARIKALRHAIAALSKD